MSENWSDLRISNDFLFGKVMRNQTVCKKLIELILGRLEYLTIEMRDQLNYERGIEQNRRSVILKAYQKGYPIEEIADLAGCDEATVISVISAASNNE